ncbi:MAG: hypothetical protein M1504_02260 [Candidatus Marsarchaeota archaeon]|nr:hypothetical protein [Candidatus Marsarchaeota archaeon]
MIETKLKLLLIIAMIYNAFLGVFAISVSMHPFIVLLFIGVDLFLIFYYMRFLLTQKLQLLKFIKSERRLIKGAQAEIAGYEYTKLTKKDKEE